LTVRGLCRDATNLFTPGAFLHVPCDDHAPDASSRIAASRLTSGAFRTFLNLFEFKYESMWSGPLSLPSRTPPLSLSPSASPPRAFRVSLPSVRPPAHGDDDDDDDDDDER
jgi:hypothetical protein